MKADSYYSGDIEVLRRDLAQIRPEQNRLSARQVVFQLWPDLRELIAQGMTYAEVCQWLQLKGVGITGPSFRTYVSILKKLDKLKERESEPTRPTVEKRPMPPSGGPPGGKRDAGDEGGQMAEKPIVKDGFLLPRTDL